jgi:hypothetical protein
VKDPWWLYTYWDIRPEAERTARNQLLPQEVAGLQSILRVYDVTGVDFPAHAAHRSFDIPLSGLATNWYIHTDAPNRAFVVEIGILTQTGRFLLLARSNRVTTPRSGPSDVIDGAWMTTEEAYAALLASSVGVGMGGSPTSWSRHPASTGHQAGVQGFWFRVDAELVIHGATDPKASVTIQGQPVTVRKDGTFSLRAALPEGTQTMTIDVTSPDGRQTRTVTPVVTLAGVLVPSADSAKPAQPTAHSAEQARES